MRLDHIGLVVPKIEAGIAHWERAFGYRQATEVVVNTRQAVKVVFMEKAGELPMKLVEPLDKSDKSAAKRPGLHHLCYYTEDLDAQIAHLKTKGMRVIAGPEPGEAFDNERIAFLFARQGLNIELIQTKKRARRIPEG